MADVTGVWPLVGVRALVNQQVVGLCEMAATELAHKLLLRLGWQAPSARLPLRGELGHVQQAAQHRRVGLGRTGTEVLRLQGVLLGSGSRQVGKVESGLVLGGAARALAIPRGVLLVWLDQVWKERDRGQRKPGIHQARELGESAAGQGKGRVAQSPLMQVYRVQGTETVDAGHMV